MSLLALAAGIFIAQTAEFLPGGLVPQIAEDFAVDVGLAGQMITVFALTVVITTAPLAMATGRAGRKTLVVVSLAVLSLGNLTVAVAPTFEWMLAARILGALAHGLFWAVVSTYAVEIVPRDKLGRAMAFTAAGGSLAGILGIPIGNALGAAFGWRQAFVAVAAVGLLATLVLWRWLPRIDRKQPPRSASPTGARWDRSIVGVAMVCLLILVLVIGQTSFGPYTTVWLEDIARFERSTIPAYLLITGIAGAVGAVIAGNLFDRYPRATFIASIVLLVGSLCVLPSVADTGFSPLLLATAIGMSIGFAGLPMMLQTRMMQTASPSMRRLAGAVQTTVFNIAIGGGALIGGILVSGIGVELLPWFAAATAVLAGTIAIAWEAARSRAAPAHSRPPDAEAERTSGIAVREL